MPLKRQITEPEKKHVAASQGWRCSGCKSLLEATYQVDHTVALMNDGRDHVSNMSAMCVSCHAKKTQQEHMDRGYKKRGEEAAPTEKSHDPLWVDTREDTVIEDGRFVKCSLCHALRRSCYD